jgi:hypothetical protein
MIRSPAGTCALSPASVRIDAAKHTTERSVHGCACSVAKDVALTIAHNERGGEVKVSDTALAEPSKAEVARQARMKREG